jgi:hypothetical protein
MRRLWAYPVATGLRRCSMESDGPAGSPGDTRSPRPQAGSLPAASKHRQSFDTFRGFAAGMVPMGHCW